MVRLPEVHAANLGLVKSQPLVAVFAGGTSGIGAYTLQALAKAHGDIGKGLRAYIIGRNQVSAQALIADCQNACPSGLFKFVKATDLALLQEVDAVCKEIVRLEQEEQSPRIDIMVMTQACPPWRSQHDTTEGLDTLMSLVYYSRMRMVSNLLPLLTASPSCAHVISVFAGGMERKLLTDDILLRKPGNYSLAQARSHVTYMKTFYMDNLIQQHPGKISFVHAFPGLVETPAFGDPEMPFYFRFLWKLFGKIIIWTVAVSAEESGARILSLASTRYPPPDATNVVQSESTQAGYVAAKGTLGKSGGGVYSANWNGESCSTAETYRKLDRSVSGMLVDHTNHVFQEIESNGKLSE